MFVVDQLKNTENIRSPECARIFVFLSSGAITFSVGNTSFTWGTLLNNICGVTNNIFCKTYVQVVVGGFQYYYYQLPIKTFQAALTTTPSADPPAMAKLS